MKSAKRIALFFSLLMTATLAYVINDFVLFSKNKETVIKERCNQTSKTLSSQIDSILVIIENEGTRLAELFGSTELTSQEIQDIVKESSLSISEIQGVTACYEPYAFSKDTRLYCPYYDKSTSDFFFVESKYDYSIKGKKTTAWYTGARDNGAMWNEPYYGAGAENWYTDYSAPFYYTNGTNKGKVRGTITLSFVLSGFKEMVHKMSLGKTGYGMIVSTKNTFLVHPTNEYIGIENLTNLLEREESPDIKNTYQKMIDREIGTVEYFDRNYKADVLFNYGKIPTSNWGIGLLFYKNDLYDGNAETNKYYMKILFFGSLLLFGILFFWFLKDLNIDKNEIWTLSIISTILLLINLFLVCLLQHTTSELSHEKTQPIVDVNSLNSFVNSINQKKELRKQDPYTGIPTGIYIEKMDFTDTYTLGISGKVWQKYPVQPTEGNAPEIGIHFPQLAAEPENVNMEEIYREVIPSIEGSDPYQLVGWNFTNLFRLNLHYADYPFDKRHIEISFKPIKNNDYLILTPDLESYNYTNPSKKSGINPKIEISGNDILDSYFNYSLQDYDTDFGFKNKEMFEQVPTLHFNIDLKRRLLNAFVTYLIPIFITLILSYILIHSIDSKSEGQGIIEAMAAFFFVLVFSHIDLRRDIGTEDLMFMEYFYFASYFMLIITTFNLFIFTKGKIKLFQFNDNQIFKATFFPVFFTLILVVAYWKFY